MVNAGILISSWRLQGGCSQPLIYVASRKGPAVRQFLLRSGMGLDAIIVNTVETSALVLC